MNNSSLAQRNARPMAYCYCMSKNYNIENIDKASCVFNEYMVTSTTTTECCTNFSGPIGLALLNRSGDIQDIIFILLFHLSPYVLPISLKIVKILTS